jgi:hypothetical protein
MSKLDNILNSPKSLTKAIAKNNFQDVVIAIQAETGTNDPDPKQAQEILLDLYTNDPFSFMNVADVRWITGKDPEIDAFVLDYAGTGNSLIKAIDSYEQKEEVASEQAAAPNTISFSKADHAIAAAFFFFLILPMILD